MQLSEGFRLNDGETVEQVRKQVRSRLETIKQENQRKGKQEEQAKIVSNVFGGGIQITKAKRRFARNYGKNNSKETKSSIDYSKACQTCYLSTT